MGHTTEDQLDTEDRLEFLGLKISKAQLAELKRRAHEDERTLSAYVRRLLRQAVREPAPVDREER